MISYVASIFPSKEYPFVARQRSFPFSINSFVDRITPELNQMNLRVFASIHSDVVGFDTISFSKSGNVREGIL